MNPELTQKAPKTVLLTIISFLVISGVLRFGAVGMALAEEGDAKGAAVAMSDPSPGASRSELETLIESVRGRAEELRKWEVELADRQKNLDAAALVIEKKLEELVTAEEKLKETVAYVNTAADDDVARLVAVYETMKPKTAVPLFGQMSPEFAAGFLGRMRPEASAAIMAGLSSDHAYAISVILAGRNAGAPKE